MTSAGSWNLGSTVNIGGATGTAGTLQFFNSGVSVARSANSGLTITTSGSGYGGGTTITNTSASGVKLTVTGAASQTANLQEWQDSSNTTLASLSASGDLNLLGGKALYSYGTGDPTTADARWGNFYNNGTATRFLTSGKGTYASNIPDMYFDKYNGTTLTTMMMLQSSTGNLGIGTTTIGTNNRLIVNPYSTVDNLATAQINTNAATNKGLVVQGLLSQTANLQEWQSSTGTSLSSVNASGAFFIGSASTSSGSAMLQVRNNTYGDIASFLGNNGTVKIIGGSKIELGSAVAYVDYNELALTNNSGNIVIRNSYNGPNSGVTIRANGTGVGTNADVVFQTQSGSVETMRIKGSGNVGIGEASPSAKLQVTNTTAATVATIIKGASGQTANLQEWQSSAGTALASVSATGAGSFVSLTQNGNNVCDISNNCSYAASSGSTSYIQNGTTIQTNANLAIQSASASSVGAVIRGAASQTANLQEWQDSAGTVLTSISSGGGLQFGAGQLVVARTAGTTLRISNAVDAGGTGGVVQVGGYYGTGSYRSGIIISAGTSTNYNGSIEFLYQGSNSSFLTAMPSTTRALKLDTRFAINTSYGDVNANTKLTVNSPAAEDATVLFGSSSSGSKGLVVQGAASQTANLQEWQSSFGTALAYVNASGDISTSRYMAVNGATLGATLSGQTAVLNVNGYAGIDGVRIGGNAILGTGGGRIDLGTNSVNIHNWVFTANALSLGTNYTSRLSIDTFSDYKGLVIRGSSSQSANLQEWQNNSGSVLTSISSAGYLNSPRFKENANGVVIGGASTPQAGTNVLVESTGGSNKALVVKGYTGQTGNLQEWQNSSGTTLSYLDNNGSLSINNSAALTGATKLRVKGGTSLSTSGTDGWTLNGVTNGTQFFTSETGSYGSPSVMGMSGEWSSSTVPTLSTYGYMGGYFGARGSGTRILIGSRSEAISLATISGDTVYGSQGIASFENPATATGGTAIGLQGTATTNTSSSGDRHVYGVSGSATSNGANTFAYGGNFTANGTGTNIALRAVSGTATTKGLVVRGASSQSANLQEWQDNTGAVLASINGAGNVFTIGSSYTITAGSGNWVFNNNSIQIPSIRQNTGYLQTVGATTILQWSNTVSNGAIEVTSTAATQKGLIVKGAASQTANLQEWQNSAGTALASISSEGNLSITNNSSAGARITINQSDPNYQAFIQTNYTGNSYGYRIGQSNTTGPDFFIQSTQSNNYFLRGGFNNQALIIGPSVDQKASTTDYGSNSAATLIVQDSRATTGVTKLVVRSGAGQSTTNLQEWQSNTGTVVSSIDSNGNLNVEKSTNAASYATGLPSVTVSNTNTSGTSFAAFRMMADNGGVVGEFFADGDASFHTENSIYFRATSNTPMLFGTNNTVRMMINKGGAVQVGSTSVTVGTAEKFRVNTPTTIDNTAASILSSGAAGNRGLVVQGVSGQTADIFQVQSHTGGMIFSTQATGGMTVAGVITIQNGNGISMNGDINGSTTLTDFVGATVRLGANPASTGSIRLANGTSQGIDFRNNANSGDLTGVHATTADGISIAGGQIIAYGAGPNTVDISHKIRIAANGGAYGTVEKFKVNASSTVDNAANAVITASDAASKPLVVQGFASQTANLQEWQDSAGTVLSSVSSSGVIYANTRFSFTGDTDTSIYRNGIDQIRMNFGGTDRIQMDNNSVLINNKLAVANSISAGGPTFGTAEKFRVNAPTTIDNSASSILSSSASTDKALVIQGAASQTANIFEVQASNGGVYTSVSNNGLLTSTNITATNTLSLGGGSASTSGAIRLVNTQAINWRNAANSGNVYGIAVTASDVVQLAAPVTANDSAASVSIGTTAAAKKGLVIQGSAAQTANLQEWQNSSAASLAGITSSGALFVGTNAAQSGGVQLANGSSQGINFRNSTNTGDLVGIEATPTAGINVGNEISINDASNDVSVQVRMRISSSTNTYGTLQKLKVNEGVVDNAANVMFAASSAGAKPLVVQAASGQTANLQEWQNSSGTPIASIKNNGSLVVGSGDQYLSSAGLTVRGTGSVQTAFIQNAASSSTSGSGIIGIQDDGAATSSGDRLGYILLGGAYDASNNAYHSAGITAFASQDFASGSGGSELRFEVMANNSSTRTLRVAIPQGLDGFTFGAAQDTNLYRNGTGTLKTNGTLQVGGNISFDPSSASSFNGTSVNGVVQITSATATAKGLVVKGAASQSANLQEWQNSSGTALFAVGATGIIGVTNSATGTEHDLGVNQGVRVGTFLRFGGGSGGANLGVIRMFNSNLINWRNAANTANIGITVNTNDTLQLGAAATTPDALSDTTIGTSATTRKGLVIQGVASQAANLQEWQNSTGTVLASISSAGNLTVVNATVNGTLVVNGASTFNGNITVNGKIITGNASGSTTVAVDTAGAGTGATASISGNDTSGVITINTGTGAAAGKLATITFSAAFPSSPNVVITPKAIPGGGAYPQYHYDSATGTFDLSSFNALTDSSTYTFSYFITD